jgi:hypothetical protein
LRGKRIEAGVRAEDLARVLGRHPESVRRIERLTEVPEQLVVQYMAALAAVTRD